MSNRTQIFSMKCYSIISLLFCYSEKLSHSLEITSEVGGKAMMLLIYQEDEKPCVHEIKSYRNAIFVTEYFKQISIPSYHGVDLSFCMNYCIRTVSCDAIFVAKSQEYGYDYENSEFIYWYEFDWCAAYKMNINEVSVIDIRNVSSVPVMETWEAELVPKESEIILINFDVCCPNKCPYNTTCTPSKTGSYLCISGFAILDWPGPEASVYLPFENNFPDSVWGKFLLADGLAQKSLYLDGQTTVDFDFTHSSGCWKTISSCKSMGFSVSFWLKVITNMGFESHGKSASIISAIQERDYEGWNIFILHYNSRNVLKIQVNDPQNPGKEAQKQMDFNFALNEWNHYTAVYQYTLPNDDPNVLFQFYKNGQPNNGGYAHYQSNTLHSDTVNKLAFGRKKLNIVEGPYPNVVLDEVIIFNGSVDATLALALYKHYQPD